VAGEKAEVYAAPAPGPSPEFLLFPFSGETALAYMLAHKKSVLGRRLTNEHIRFTFTKTVDKFNNDIAIFKALLQHFDDMPIETMIAYLTKARCFQNNGRQPNYGDELGGLVAEFQNSEVSTAVSNLLVLAFNKVLDQEGGKKATAMKRSTKRVLLQGKSRESVVYTNTRGTEFVRLNHEYRRLSAVKNK
jgi:hypothetical protein